MPVPDYQTFMRPVLLILSDGQTWKMRDLYARLAADLSLTDADLAEMLPSGRQSTYMNRIGWAKTYLVKAGALHSPQRGTVEITGRGRQLLAQFPERVTTRALSAFPEFAEFQMGGPAPSAEQNGPAVPQTLSPEEQLDALYADLNASLHADLLAQVRGLTPAQFERLVVQLLVAMGYGGNVRDAGAALGRSGDNGIDGVVKQDALGLDKIYLQAKQWAGNVGSQEVRNFSGSLTYHKAGRGVLLTTAGFSPSAVETARQIGNIVLIGGEQLAELMTEYGVGVLTRSTYLVRRVDGEYFEEL
ncbi:restriction endonuclease [Deinococcus sp. Leaf326]|uniref:restriction endonuclease n=1 Tax=Deinococcus sp. Leaf326 TaxID=1736338 RepID=UPI0006FEC4E6|nr:restriction endonuclease [Deinococcus sp. Leaf326]KQR40889.1 restriction endonuclease [Deinococcus sp. Leaf326]